LLGKLGPLVSKVLLGQPARSLGLLVSLDTSSDEFFALEVLDSVGQLGPLGKLGPLGELGSWGQLGELGPPGLLGPLGQLGLFGSLDVHGKANWKRADMC
jgi:hypothetical protein